MNLEEGREEHLNTIKKTRETKHAFNFVKS